ncbi:MAG: Ku protein [Nitriliruptorales bacterium]|nr:Ku protein [Nitriliruptorales bacterium]
MARPVWTGVISFGLVTVPVAMYSATEDHSIHFHQLERGTSDRIRYQRVNERTRNEVDYSDIVKGVAVGDGDYVIVEQQELDDIAPGRSKSLEIDTFVDLDEISPVHYQRTYWLAPAKQEYGKAYRLLHGAMAKTNRAGVGMLVMRGRQHLAVVRAAGEVLALQTMLFADEIRDPATVLDNLAQQGQPPQSKELDSALALLQAMSGPWQPEDYRDTYTDQVRQLIEDKRQGRQTVSAPAPARPTEQADLLDVLQRSVQAARGRKTAAGGTQDAAASDLGALRKTDLDEMARRLQIRGRTRMRRDELERAVAEAGQERPARQRTGRKAS